MTTAAVAAAPPTADAKPFLTIVPTSGWAALNLRDTWQFRDLLMSLAGRDLKLRYKQTVLGVIWVVLQPLMAAGIFSFVFGQPRPVRRPRRPLLPVQLRRPARLEPVQRAR